MEQNCEAQRARNCVMGAVTNRLYTVLDAIRERIDTTVPILMGEPGLELLTRQHLIDLSWCWHYHVQHYLTPSGPPAGGYSGVMEELLLSGIPILFCMTTTNDEFQMFLSFANSCEIATWEGLVGCINSFMFNEFFLDDLLSGIYSRMSGSLLHLVLRETEPVLVSARVQMLCHSISPVDWADLFEVFSQLNGTHGEWTNSDDVDRALKQLREAFQEDISDDRHPQAKNVVIKVGSRNSMSKPVKKVNIPRENSRNASRRVNEHKQRASRATLQSNNPTPDQKPKRLTMRLINIEGPCGWDGKHAYLPRTDPDTQRILAVNVSTGLVCETIAYSTIVPNVVKSGLGFIDVYVDDGDMTETSTTCCLSPWEPLCVEGLFQWEGFEFTERIYNVFTPALLFLKQKFASMVISESLCNGMLAALNREFNLGNMNTLLLDTVQAYIHQSHRCNWLMARNFVCKSKPVIKDRVDESYLSVVGIERNERSVVRYDSVDCEVPDKYYGREDCLIVSRSATKTTSWCGQKPSDFTPGIQASYPRFETSEPGANGHKYYRSNFLQFHGSQTQPFLTYSVNAANACKALKRLAGAREDQQYDHYLSTMQYSAFGEVLSRSTDVHEFIANNRSFFDVGRLEVEVNNGYITKFKVGPSAWDSLELGLDDPNGSTTMRRLSYVTPYLTRPASDLVAPVHKTQSFVSWGFDSAARLSRTFGFDGFGLLDTKMVSKRESRGNDEDKLNYRNRVCYSTSLYDHIVSSPSWDPLANLSEYYYDGHASSLRNFMGHEYAAARYTGNVLELNAVHQQMSDGFKQLMNSHVPETITAYAKEHPSWIYLDGWIKHLTHMDSETDRRWHSGITHVKKVLRQMYVERELVHTPVDIMVKQIEGKVKKEFAKFGKVPRLFVTYDAGAMYANQLPEYSKICLDGTRSFTCNGISFDVTIFAKPSSEKLHTEMNRVIDAMSTPNHVNVLIYSDDSVWSGNVNGCDFAFNVDISSCDSGNKAGTFGLVYTLLSQFRSDLSLGLVSQCAKPIDITNPENKDESMRVTMATFFEGSGTVLTTILNHVAMYMIGQAAVSIIGHRCTSIERWEDIRDMILESGVCFGHVLTIDACLDGSSFCPEKIQFLKRSPLLTTSGVYVPCMNYGPIFRSFGSVEGDMVAEMVGLGSDEFSSLSWDERWDLFGSRVIAGLVNEPSSLILNALRTRYSRTPKYFNAWSDVSFGKDRCQFNGFNEAESLGIGGDSIEAWSLARRYDCSITDLETLVSQINSSKFGDVYSSIAISSFFRTDYGVGDM